MPRRAPDREPTVLEEVLASGVDLRPFLRMMAEAARRRGGRLPAQLFERTLAEEDDRVADRSAAGVLPSGLREVGIPALRGTVQGRVRLMPAPIGGPWIPPTANGQIAAVEGEVVHPPGAVPPADRQTHWRPVREIVTRPDTGEVIPAWDFPVPTRAECGKPLGEVRVAALDRPQDVSCPGCRPGALRDCGLGPPEDEPSGLEWLDGHVPGRWPRPGPRERGRRRPVETSLRGRREGRA
jgi:hypothetical protein